MTTVGFGDISPASLGGRLIGVVLMFFGIGVLGMFTATIAGVFVEKRLRKERGMDSYDLAGHIILCEWNDRTREILKDLRADPRAAEAPIVLIADIEAKPVADEQLFFVRGKLTEETLKRAGIERGGHRGHGRRPVARPRRAGREGGAVGADGGEPQPGRPLDSSSWPARRT